MYSVKFHKILYTLFNYFSRAGMALKDKAKHSNEDKKPKQKIAVPHPGKNWRYKNGVWYFVKENKQLHKGDYHGKFLLPAVTQWRQSLKKKLKLRMKNKHSGD